MGETHEAPQDHTLADFGPHPGYATERHAFPGAPTPNTSGRPRYQSPPRPLHFAIRGVHSIVLEKEMIEHMEERLRAIEGGGNYAFADMAELCLVPDMVIPPKFKVPNFDKYKGTSCP